VRNSAPPHDGQSTSQSDPVADEVVCQQFVELVTDYFEGSLQPRTMSRVEEHLVICDWCVTYAEQMQTTIASLGELREQGSPEPPDAVLSVLRARRAG
jgi:predicted anti-sigma-YlaC factor YlaD